MDATNLEMPPRGALQEMAAGATEPDMDDGTVCVPLASLAQPDDQEKMNTPEVGDSVSMQVDAQVVKIEGDNAYIKPTSINGNSLSDNDEDEGGESAEASDLRDQAQALS